LRSPGRQQPLPASTAALVTAAVMEAVERTLRSCAPGDRYEAAAAGLVGAVAALIVSTAPHAAREEAARVARALLQTCHDLLNNPPAGEEAVH